MGRHGTPRGQMGGSRGGCCPQTQGFQTVSHLGLWGHTQPSCVPSVAVPRARAGVHPAAAVPGEPAETAHLLAEINKLCPTAWRLQGTGVTMGTVSLPEDSPSPPPGGCHPQARRLPTPTHREKGGQESGWAGGGQAGGPEAGGKGRPWGSTRVSRKARSCQKHTLSPQVERAGAAGRPARPLHGASVPAQHRGGQPAPPRTPGPSTEPQAHLPGPAASCLPAQPTSPQR